MPLPARAFYYLSEAAVKWDCLPAHIVGWAASGRIEIAVSVSQVIADGKPMAGLMALPGEDILPLFHQGEVSREPRRKIAVRRIRPINSKLDPWIFFEVPDQGIQVSLEDILILQDEYEAFSKAIGAGLPRKHAPPKYDWDAMYVALIKRIHFEGLPATKTALLREMQEWFMRNSEDGEFPDERTMRSRIYPVFDAIMQTERVP